uniref:hypothetical protein n=1 Tax=Pseudomonas sp. ef1 TaxID=2578139 RepID=UPI001C49B634
SIPPLSLPTSPVDQDQKRYSSLRSLLSGAALPRAAALLCFCFCGSEPAREGGLTADLFLEVVLDPIVGVSLLAMRHLLAPEGVSLFNSDAK